MNIDIISTDSGQDSFVKLINETRKKNKDQWYYLIVNFKGHELELKGYNTWLQRLNIDGIDFSFPMGKSVKDFKDELSMVWNDIEG